MKPIHLAPVAAIALVFTSCERKSSADSQTDLQSARQIAELERQNNEAIARQRQLEQELEEQKLAAERDAIERERQLIEEARIELEQREIEQTAAEAEALIQRERDLAAREGQVELLTSTLEEKQATLDQRENHLSERDRQLAGREAIALQNEESEEDVAPAGDYGMFYDSLSSYGSWFESPDYGYVWQPVVVRDVSWRPYTRGRWACSNQGWTWISDEPFGWATYHYGRWALCRNRGWIWVPGSQWAPSWVSWRSSGNHVGWAPLPPETLAYRENRWDSSVDVTFGIGAPWFVFVETRYFGNPIHRHCLPYDRNPVFIQQTINITHIHVQNRRIICGGPTYGDVQRQVERPLPFYRLEMDRHNRSRDSVSMRPRVEGNRLRVSAPNVETPWNQGLRPAKVRGRMDDMQVVRAHDVRPEITDRFRQSRQEEIRKANQSIQEMGGENQLSRHRLDLLTKNQQAAEEKRRRDAASNSKQVTTAPQDRRPSLRPIAETRPPAAMPGNGAAGKPTDDRSKANGSAPISKPVSRDTETRPTIRPTATSPNRQSRPLTPEARPGIGAPPVAKPRTESKTVIPENSNPPRKDTNTKAPPQAKPTEKPHPRPMTLVPEDPIFRRKDPKETDNRPTVTPPTSPRPTPKPQDNTAERARQQQMEEAQREKARQQQQEAQRQQQERARQQQMEEAQREKARQQQQEAQRQQQERARQQQMEDAQRERARQQQQEAQRQQQERARQQQQEAQRQQQMEQARREQAQQQETLRQREQQERARQQQDQDERRLRTR